MNILTFLGVWFISLVCCGVALASIYLKARKYLIKKHGMDDFSAEMSALCITLLTLGFVLLWLGAMFK